MERAPLPLLRHAPHRPIWRQRLVINQSRVDLGDRAGFFISNRLLRQAPSITRIRCPCWPVEVYHEEGKAEGLDQYQVRDFQAIERYRGTA